MSLDRQLRRSDLDEYRKRLTDTDLLVERQYGVKGKLLPQRISAALRAFRQRHKYKRMLVVSEGMGLLLAGLFKFSSWPGKIYMIVHAAQGPRRRRFFPWTDSKTVAKYVVYCEQQRTILVEEHGIDADKVHTLLNPVDTQFFDPARVDTVAGSGGYVFSCGLENRDYVTLARAAAKLEIPFIIQATGYFEENTPKHTNPSNYDIRKQRVSFERLRQLYHESALSVVPLNSSLYAAGVNGILEAMAMGKAVIAMDSPGLRDYYHSDGVRVVPPNDPDAMAQAIAELHAAPELCAEMGRKNRDWIVANCEVSDFSDRLFALMD